VWVGKDEGGSDESDDRRASAKESEKGCYSGDEWVREAGFPPAAKSFGADDNNGDEKVAMVDGCGG
jgi:hypothetical protein